jgi:hypothetical protein
LQRANLEGSDEFITPPELIGEINTSLAEWHDLVTATTWNGTQVRRRYNFTTTASTSPVPYVSPPPGSFYPLPQAFLRLLSVDIAISNNLVITAQAFQEENRNIFKYYPVGAWIWNQPIYYQLQDNNIVFIPGPIGQFQVQVNFVPTAPQLARPLDTFDSINSWEEFIVLDVAIKLLIKDGQTDMIQVLEGLREAQRARIKSLAPKRDQQTAEMIHETFDMSPWQW